jgi:hypothetical protein
MEKNSCTIKDSLNNLEVLQIHTDESVSHTLLSKNEKTSLNKVITLALKQNLGCQKRSLTSLNFSIAKARQLVVSLLKMNLTKEKEASFFSEKPHVFEESKVSQREEDVFRMKAITLIQNHSSLFPSIQKALASLKEAPIYTVDSSNTKFNNLMTNSIITLEQKLTPFPGETIVLKGAFIRSSNALTPTIPIRDSFELSMKSEQTGFPHPSQYIGWSLSDALIPLQSHGQKQIKSIFNLLKKKETISNELQLQSLSAVAKKILGKREACVNDHREEFLFLQEKFSIALIKAALKDISSLNLQFISQFFVWLQSQPSVYSLLSNTYFLINENFVLLPFKKLLQVWLDQRCNLSNELKITFLEARAILESAREETLKVFTSVKNKPKLMFDYIMIMGSLIGPASDRIILQHLSEIMKFPPPFLTGFEKKLQSAAYKQLELFISELTNKNSEGISFTEIKKLLELDIELFEQPNFISNIIEELEPHYFSRFTDLA